MRVVSIVGMLGAGKSSLIRALLDEGASRGQAGGVVINDAGEVELDTPEVTDRYPVTVIGGG